jgi:hypothetical protein
MVAKFTTVLLWGYYGLFQMQFLKFVRLFPLRKLADKSGFKVFRTTANASIYESSVVVQGRMHQDRLLVFQLNLV